MSDRKIRETLYNDRAHGDCKVIKCLIFLASIKVN